MLVFQNYLDNQSFTFGAKGKRLSDLKAKGFNVPNLVLIPAEVIEEIVQNNQVLETLQSEIVAVLSANTYAVRSAASIEDAENSSLAGQFKTILNVPKSNLTNSILEVINDAKSKGFETGKFSIIIQDCIQPDWAGVIFSRNPLGKREMVIEYNQGDGESVVGGKSSLRIDLFPHEADLHKEKLPKIKELVNLAKEIEAIYKWPQDIEWAIKDEVLYLLQARPVTGFSSALWQGIQYLDRELSLRDSYFYEQTNLVETFDKPRTLAFSILNNLYQKGGPINLAYQKIGVFYQETSQFKFFGNQLFVDKDAEIKAVFPALGYLKKRSLSAKFESLQGFLVTLRNSVFLSVVSDNRQELKSKITNLLQNKLDFTKTLRERWEFLMKNYQLIFEINLRSQKAIEKLTFLLKDDSFLLSVILSNNQDSDSFLALVKANEDYLQGNSINIDDVTLFIFGKFSAEHEYPDKNFRDWWEDLPKWKQFGLEKPIAIAKNYMELRELGRSASVKMISYLRLAIEELGHEKFVANPELIYFETIEEILNENFNYESCLKRYNLYQANKTMIFPKQVISYLSSECDKDTNVGLSAGLGEGILVSLEEIDKIIGKKILHVSALSPDLTKYFDKIEGIISEQGGILSHLAIMAREAQLPIVVSRETYPLNRKLKINGSTGEVTYLEG